VIFGKHENNFELLLTAGSNKIKNANIFSFNDMIRK